MKNTPDFVFASRYDSNLLILTRNNANLVWRPSSLSFISTYDVFPWRSHLLMSSCAYSTYYYLTPHPTPPAPSPSGVTLKRGRPWTYHVNWGKFFFILSLISGIKCMRTNTANTCALCWRLISWVYLQEYLFIYKQKRFKLHSNPGLVKGSRDKLIINK